MSKIVISYNFPIPKRNDQEPRTSSAKRYPFEEMNVGGSFFIWDRTPHQLLSAALCWAGRYNKRHGKKRKFTVRETGEGARIWRVK